MTSVQPAPAPRQPVVGNSAAAAALGHGEAEVMQQMPVPMDVSDSVVDGNGPAKKPKRNNKLCFLGVIKRDTFTRIVRSLFATILNHRSISLILAHFS
jgi:hypothetical protein